MASQYIGYRGRSIHGVTVGVGFRTCQVASRHCLSLFIKNISDEEVRGEGEIGYSYGRRVMCTVATESWGKALGIQDGSGHFGRSLKLFVVD